MSQKYEIKAFSNLIRVVNTEKERVEGYWNQEQKHWFDVQKFIAGEPQQ